MPNIDPAKCWIDGAAPDALPTAEELAEHGALVAFQLVAVRFLTSWLPLAPVVSQARANPITYADKKTVASEVTAALRSIGISLVISLDSGQRGSATLHSILFSPLRFALSVAENPVTNRSASGSNITCSAAAELAMLCFSGVRIGNGQASVVSFDAGGESGALQTADIAFQTEYLVPTPASLLASA